MESSRNLDVKESFLSFVSPPADIFLFRALEKVPGVFHGISFFSFQGRRGHFSPRMRYFLRKRRRNAVRYFRRHKFIRRGSRNFFPGHRNSIFFRRRRADLGCGRSIQQFSGRNPGYRFRSGTRLLRRKIQFFRPAFQFKCRSRLQFFSHTEFFRRTEFLGHTEFFRRTEFLGHTELFRSTEFLGHTEFFRSTEFLGHTEFFRSTEFLGHTELFLGGLLVISVHRLQGRRRSEEHTSELQSPDHLVCRLLLEKKKLHLELLRIHLKLHVKVRFHRKM